MSRSGYTDELDQGQAAMWRGAVRSAITGKRGQAFLRELLAALDTMPDKKLIEHDLRDATGQVCTLGSIGVARQVDLEKLDPEDHETLSATFNIAEALVREIEYENDEGVLFVAEDPEHRWQRMREWVAAQIISRALPPTPEQP